MTEKKDEAPPILPLPVWEDLPPSKPPRPTRGRAGLQLASFQQALKSGELAMAETLLRSMLRRPINGYLVRILSRQLARKKQEAANPRVLAAKRPPWVRPKTPR